ncbi:c-type cytochrome [Flavobacteriaceae bacterium F89]|uniref:C-type cytochrome n=1 Tax=Cerina litoralis TaxID=2874477 RepID=A0AAE3EVE8_9FLAO|nr:cytochrome c peroxidase [Cerina litoralis]MCG2461795.1 c-type cytochrome [Cerina litoralis]
MTKKSILVKFSATGLLVFCAMFLFRKGETTYPYQNIQALNSNCPPGFKLNDKNECISQNLYKQYSSSNDPGVGGLKTALPEVREGFSPQEIDLGRYLFFDPVLSGTGTISCATCHNPKKGFSDGLATSTGANNHKLKRAAPTLWNVAYDKLFLWDGGAHSLEEQMRMPLFSEYEMANTPENLLNTINSIENYRDLFAEAFTHRDPTKEITLDEIFTSLVAFESSLVSLNSKYDQYAHGYHQALNQQEIEGLNIFRSFVARCAECHTPPLFTNQQIAVIGVPEPDGLPLDPGAQVPYRDSTMRGGFKVPSLRNITKTAPYMHSGTFATLREAVEFYNDGRGHAVPKGEHLRIHWHIWEPDLSDYEMDRIVDFLKTLTDESFMPKIPEEVPSGLKPTVSI